MRKDTFGPPEKYKALVCLTKKIELLDKNKREYISSFINDFNKLVNNNPPPSKKVVWHGQKA